MDFIANDMKIKVFISIPMSGRTEEEVDNEYNHIADHIKYLFNENKVVICDQRRPDDSVPSHISNNKEKYDMKDSSIWHLSKDIEIFSSVDIVVFAKNYEKARGCRIEEMVAKEYGIERYYM